MNRRSFLWLSIAGTTVAGIPFLSCTGNETAALQVAARPQLLSGFCDEQALRQIGRAYRQQTPSENSRDRLQELLLAGDSGKAGNSSAHAAAIRSSLEQMIRQDFEQNRITIINGWIISQTEARQCALFSLL